MRQNLISAARTSSYYAFMQVRYAGRYYRAYYGNGTKLAERYKVR
jgi:hypothetical protein